ncbi:helix-turn-helix domain-containing protein [Streptomyces sp. NPDC057909]|uniref:helix-turn-helix domain-containing protein n=1 Tax=Streptomyces sp. NPDC057909 TaxID=3346277 RepID=UPI0036EAC950
MTRYHLRSERLRTAAAAKGDLSGYAISKRTGLAESTLSRLRRGLASPTTASLMALARAYDVPIDDLVEDRQASKEAA